MTYPLTDFLVRMMATDRVTLLRADPDKLAAKYGIPADWARAYLNDWVGK